MAEHKYITLNQQNIEKEHICCGFSDKKCAEGYAMKKEWLREGFGDGLVFRRLDERAKVFMEYIPAEKAWVPVNAPGYLFIGCFWVSGKYKGHGHAKELLQSALEDAEVQGKNGLVTVTGTKKFPFMSDDRWLLDQGFEMAETLPNGFRLLVRKIRQDAADPGFKEQVRSCEIKDKDGIVVFYSNRCPYNDYYINELLKAAIEKRGLKYKIVKLETMEQAQDAPTPATIFSVFRDGRFVTTDLSICLDNRFDKFVK